MRFWTTDWSYNDFFNRLTSLGLPMETFVPKRPLVLGVDEML